MIDLASIQLPLTVIVLQHLASVLVYLDLSLCFNNFS